MLWLQGRLGFSFVCVMYKSKNGTLKKLYVPAQPARREVVIVVRGRLKPLV